MRFVFGNDVYAIEFRRQPVLVRTYRKGKAVDMQSTYPATTASILRLDPKEEGLKNAEIVAAETASCYVKDAFSLEAGRKAALKKVCESKRIPREMKPFIWKTYLRRGEEV